MVNFEKSIFINRSQQEVFDFISDPANDPKWQSSAEFSEWTSEGPPGVGSTQHSVARLMGRKIDSTMEVTAWDPPNTYAFKVLSGPIPFQAAINLEVKENGTQVTFSGNAEVGGFFKLAEGLVGKQLKKTVSDDWDNLKTILEEA